MSEVIAKQAIKWLKKIAGKFEQTRGVRVWGETTAGTIVLFRVDADGHLQIDALTIANPPNLDVALSTRASETKLESLRALLDELEDALASVGTDELRVISV